MTEQAFTEVELHIDPTRRFTKNGWGKRVKAAGGRYTDGKAGFRIVTVPVAEPGGVALVDKLVARFFAPTSRLAEDAMTAIARGGAADLMEAREIVISVKRGSGDVVDGMRAGIAEAIARTAVDVEPKPTDPIVPMDMIYKEQSAARRALKRLFRTRTIKHMLAAADDAWDRVHMLLTLQATGAIAGVLSDEDRLPRNMQIIPTGIAILVFDVPVPDGWSRLAWLDQPQSRRVVAIAAREWFATDRLYGHIAANLTRSDFEDKPGRSWPLPPMTEWRWHAVDVDRSTEPVDDYRADEREADEVGMLAACDWLQSTDENEDAA